MTDSTGLSDQQVFTVTVTDNRPPVLESTIPDQTATVGQTFSLDVSAFFSDPDGDALTWTATAEGGGALPAWLNLDGALLSGTPAAPDVELIEITVSATDPAGTSASTPLQLVVVDASPEAPQVIDQVFRISPSSANGAAVGTVVASDANLGDILTYTIAAGNDDGVFGIDANTGLLAVNDNTGRLTSWWHP